MMQRVKQIPPIAWLVTAFLVLAIFYSIIIPLFEGPDEDDHFRYVKFIADHHALPVQSFEPGGGDAGHQGWQPPLYYSLAAMLIAPIDTSDFSRHLWRNEYVTFVGDPACCGRNIYYHTDSENFPYTGTILAVHLARLLSILFGAIAVGATYALVRAMGQSSGLALAAASVVAFNPSFLFTSALVSNDAALAAVSSLALWVWVKLISGPLPLRPRSAAILGVLLALAILVKTTALGLAPLSILLLAVLAWRRRSLRSFVWSSLAMLIPVILLSGWWFVRNQMLYGDPLAARLVAASALFPRTGDLTLAEFFQISLPQFWTTFWGGPTPSDFSPILLALLALLTISAAVGSLLYYWRITNQVSRFTFCFLLAWLGLLFVAMIQFVRTTQGGDQGRYLFPAISAFACFFVIGLNELAQRASAFFRQVANTQSRFPIFSISQSLILLFPALALFVPLAYTLPAYARPPLLLPQDLARLADTTHTNFANQIELLGFDLDARSHKPGELVRVTLYWRALAPMQESYRVFVHLIGQNNSSVGGIDAIPARGAFPTVYWKPGDALRDDYYLPIAKNAQPGKYALEVGLYPVGKPGERLMTVGSNDDRVLVASVKVAPLQAPAYAPATPVNAVFADQIELMGYDASVAQNQARLILYWRALKPIARDYTVFVHALDESGKIVAQTDRQPQDGNYSTSIWDAGEEVRDEYLFDLPSSARRIAIGLYRADTSERLQIVAPAGTTDRVEFSLGTLP